MKKIYVLGVAALGVLGLASCSASSVKSTTVYSENEEGELQNFGKAKLTFKENSKVPYISVKDGVELMSNSRSKRLNDKAKFTVTNSNGELVITNERNSKCVINKDNQSITFDDYDNFGSIYYEGQNPLLITEVSPKITKAITLVKSEYTKGKPVTISLNSYSKLDIFEKDGDFYMPVSAFSSVLYTPLDSGSVAYNFNDLFIVPNGLTKEVLGLNITTPLGEEFKKGMKGATLSQDYVEYYYQSLCLDFDINYGLKDKFKNFDEYVASLNLKNDFLQTNAKMLDSTTAAALSYLNDGHTDLADLSAIYELEDDEMLDNSKYNKAKTAADKAAETYEKNRKASGVRKGLDYQGDVAFVTFDSFEAINDLLLYSELGEKDLSDTATLFSELYKDITKDFSIRNIVVDLSGNTGGDAQSLVYALSTLYGEVTFDVSNPLSGATTHQTYKADINLDGKIDDKDIGLVNYGINIFFINSKYTFSSGNAMAVYAKENNSNVIMLGDKTGGGPCAIKKVVSAIGNTYAHSSLTTLSKKVNGAIVNIDGGVEADYILTEEQMMDRNYVKANLSKWLEGKNNAK